jgi:hypothetical protein
MKSIGTVKAGLVTPGALGIRTNDGAGGGSVNLTDAAVASGNAFLASELEKKDSLLREPLSSITYPRDIPVKTGGGWVEFITSMSLDYGMTGGNIDGAVHAIGANTPPVIQVNLDTDRFTTHAFSVVMRIMFLDMQRNAITGRSVERLLQDGIRKAYDKHQEANVYVGLQQYGTTGLINNPNVAQQQVAVGTGGDTEWDTKTPDEILKDINLMIEEGWEAAEWDLDGMPNHIILPYKQYNYIATQKVSDLAEKTILTFLEENNIASKNGRNLVIGATSWLKGAGAGGEDRAVAYVNNDRFIAVEELVPLARTMTQPNIDALAYDSVFMANLSEVEIFYYQPINYFDGI